MRYHGEGNEVKMVNSDGTIPNVDREMQLFLATLKQDNYSEAKSLFAKDQTAGLFPKGEKLLPWMVSNLGKKATLKFINYFVHNPCIYCREGLKECENCGGKGHLGNELICDSCLSLGLKPCDFCAGTGWCTIDYVPPGLRFAVFLERIKVAKKRIKTILLKPLPEISKTEDTKEILKRYIKYLFDLNRQIVVLETMTDVTKQLVEEASPEHYNKKIPQFVQKCTKTVYLSKRRIVTIITQMISLSKMEAENPDRNSIHRSLFSERIKFLNALLTATPQFHATFLEHPFLNKEVKSQGLIIE